MKVLCPVCEDHWFEEEGDYYYCPNCRWENDGYLFGGGANGLSVNEAKLKYRLLQNNNLSETVIHLSSIHKAKNAELHKKYRNINWSTNDGKLTYKELRNERKRYVKELKDLALNNGISLT